MVQQYQFEYEDMKFSKDGSMDELIALDRYAIQSFDNYIEGDTVVFTFFNESKGIDEKRIGEIKEINGDIITVKDRFNEIHKIDKENMHKPLETEPQQLWTRWAKGGASVEKNKKLRDWFENELRWLFDGYRYSLGGRIQLMLGQEYVTGERANLTAYNCFVLDLPKAKNKPLDQFLEVLRVAKQEIDIQRRGGGTGITISNINTVKGAGIGNKFINIIIPKEHKDYKELEERMSIGKFEGVTVNAPIKKNSKKFTIEDSTDGLYKDLRNMVIESYSNKEIEQLNLDFTDIRHRNAIVKGVNGRSSGAVSWAELFVLVARLLQQETINNVEFAEIYSAITHLIEQGGSRRGALMLINSAENENAEFFIKRKKELGYLSGANISVDLSDGFMKKVKEGSKKELELWNLIIEYAWKSAEPGVVFLERYNKESNSWYYNPIVSTNPCFTGDMKLLTVDGYKTFEELEKEDEVYIVNKDGVVSRGKVWCSGEKNIVEVKLGNKEIITCTPDHRFMTNEGEELEAKDLKGYRLMPYLNERNDHDMEYTLFGFIQGDGQTTRLASPEHKGIEVNVGKDDIEIRHLFRQNYKLTEREDGRHIYIQDNINDKLRELGFDPSILPEREFPSTYDNWDLHKKRSFLRGCYSANGSVLNVGRVTYKTTSIKFAEKLIETLENDFGIHAYLTTNKAKEVEFDNGVYLCKESYDVNIANHNGKVKFYNEIGFIHRYKMFKLKQSLIESSPLVTSVKETGRKENVYDFNEPISHWGVVEGYVAHNCGEQGLPEMGVCNLGHFVLPRFYDENNNDVNWEELKRAIKIAVRLQDNIIDYTQYFLKENEKVQKEERRVGIGTMGLGTLMIKLGLRYGSPEGNEFVDKLYKFIATEAYKASIDLAEEKGKFPKCEPEKMAQSGFMKRLLPELPKEYRDKFFETGIRNVTLLTQAPTGSTSTYIDNIPMFREKFGGVTGGIEPYFSWEYFRASRLGVSKQTVAIAEQYMKEHNIKSIKDLPDYFVTAMQLSPQDHVNVQAAVQKWTDSSISKTANCPADFTIEETSELYMSGYDKGLKGLTIYRDSSRDAQVLATSEEDAKLETHIEKRQAKENTKKENKVIDNITQSKSVEFNPSNFIKKRPKRLHGFTDKIRFMYGDKQGKAYVTVNMKDNQVWEVFITTKEKEVSSMAKALGLMTTKLLRLGATGDNLQQAIDTLSYDQIFGTLPHSVAQILKDIQKENIIREQEETGEIKLAKCPECSAEAYDKANCICYSCGQSNCN